MTSKKYFCSVPTRVGIIRLLIALSCIPFQPEAQPDTYLAIQRRIDQASPKAHCRLQLKRNGRLVWWSTLPRAHYNLCPVPSKNMQRKIWCLNHNSCFVCFEIILFMMETLVASLVPIPTILSEKYICHIFLALFCKTSGLSSFPQYFKNGKDVAGSEI